MKKNNYCNLLSYLLAFASMLSITVTVNAQVNRITSYQRSKIEMQLPTGQKNRLEVSSIDTSLGTRILSAMNVLWSKTLSFNQHGISASVIVPGLNQWSGSVGINYAGHPMDTNLLCEAGSITKTFVTALIMRMQDAGKLSIKDSICKWLPRHYPNVDSGITIEMLLNHSSGIYDYTNDDSDQTVLYDQYETDPSKVWTADTILLNYVKAPNFKPGKDFRYSNTNFVLLGLIAEKVGGTSLRNQLHSNFIDPLILNHTFVGGIDSISIPFAHNWSAADSKYPSTDLSFIDKTAQLTGSPGDGNICSTPSDLARWGRSLYLGNIVSPDALKQMETLHHWKNGLSYGLGTEFAPYYNHSFYGHSGGMVGFSSAMFVNPKDSVCVALYLNWDADPTVTDVYLNDYLIAILNEIYKSSSLVSESSKLNDVILAYPNPANNFLTFIITLEEPTSLTVALYNELGNNILNFSNQSFAQGRNEFGIDVSKVKAGLYFYRIQSSKQAWAGKIFIK